MLLSARGLSVEYRQVGRVSRAVNDVSLDIARGVVNGLVGESGSGKSTLALALLGLTRSRSGRIVSGSVTFEGRELLGLSEGGWREFRGNKIGLVTQNPRGALNPVQQVGDQIAQYYRAHRPVTRKKATERALELLKVVGINDPERRYFSFPHELSGGMAQRVLIAMALSCSPELLIADEPTSGLDVTIQAQVLDDMKRSVETVGAGLLLITQDLGIVANYCDRVSLMHAGEMVEEAPVERFFAEAAHPATAALFAAQDVRYNHDVVNLRGLPVDTRRLPDGCWLSTRCPFAAAEAGCYATHPELRLIGPGHHVRCHRAEDITILASDAPHRRAEPERA